MEDDRPSSGGFGPVLAVLLLAVLVLGLGGGGLVVVTTMRYRTQAMRAEEQARAQLELQQSEALKTRAALDQAQARAAGGDAKQPATAPADPLTDVNDAFRAAYKSARQDALASAGPVIVVSGDDLVLVRDGKRTSARVVPPVYHDLKAFSHIPLAAYLLTRPGLTDDRRAELTMFANKVEATRGLWDRPAFTDEQRRRQQTIVDDTLRYLKDADKAISPADRTAFARKLAPLVLANSADAAKAQIDGMHKQVTAWRTDLPPEAWKKLRVVVCGSQMPRQGNLAVQYFAWLLGEPGEGPRIVYAEGIFDEPKALNLLGTHQLDTDVGAAFFNDPRRMHRDLLADAAKEVLKGMKP